MQSLPSVTRSRRCTKPTGRIGETLLQSVGLPAWNVTLPNRWQTGTLPESRAGNWPLSFRPFAKNTMKPPVRSGKAWLRFFAGYGQNDYRADDPADDALDELVAQVKSTVKHRESLHFSEVSGAINKLRFGYALRTTALAFEFLILTAARTSEVRFMTWEEVDLENALWEIPADRMKAKRSHKVPLSNQAVNILYGLKHLPDPDAEPGSLFATYEATSGYVFLMPNGKDAIRECVSESLQERQVGFVFRMASAVALGDYAKAVYGASWEAAELSLAHSIGTTVSQAYFRTDLIDERRPLMQAWADYLDPLPF